MTRICLAETHLACAKQLLRLEGVRIFCIYQYSHTDIRRHLNIPERNAELNTKLNWTPTESKLCAKWTVIHNRDVDVAREG